MANTIDFVGFTGGVNIKIDGDDGREVPAGMWIVETNGTIIEIRHAITDRLLHSFDVSANVTKINGSTFPGSSPATKATEYKEALRSLFFKANSSAGGSGVTVNRVFLNVDKLNISSDLELCTVPTYDGSGVAIHPSTLYFPNGWKGYKYWMAMTPYPNADPEFENPSVLVSDDGKIWATPSGVTNPLVASPAGSAFNSDTHLVYGVDDKLYLIYRDSLVANTDRILYMYTSDGKTWTTPTVIISADISVQRIVSPAVWYDNALKKWVLIGVDIVPSPNVVKRFTADTIGGTWSAPTTVTVTPAFDSGREPWHIDARLVGDTVVALIQDTVLGGSTTGRLYLAVSYDYGQTFTKGVNKLGFELFYRSCFIPAISDRGFSLDLFAASLTTIKRAQVTAIGGYADFFIKHAQEIIAAARKSYPFVIGDDFTRADATGGLGTSTSGTAWTASTGVIGISSNEAYLPSAANARAYIDGGISDYEVALLVRANSSQCYLVVRAVDGNNFIRFGLNTNVLRVERITGGGVGATHLDITFTNISDNLRLSAVAVGSTIKFYVNGVIVKSVTDTQGLTSTLTGIQANNTAVRFDDFYVKRIV